MKFISKKTFVAVIDVFQGRTSDVKSEVNIKCVSPFRLLPSNKFLRFLL